MAWSCIRCLYPRVLNETESILADAYQPHAESSGDTCMQGTLPSDATETIPGLHDFMRDENGVDVGVSGGLDKGESEDSESSPAKEFESR